MFPVILGIVVAVAIVTAIVALLSSKSDADENFPKKPPGQSVEPCPDADKQRKLVQVVEVYTFKGAKKTRPVETRKQYINLDDKVDADAEHPDYGRVIRLKAKVEWVKGSGSLAGHPVYWYIKPDAGNRAGLTGTEKEGFDSDGSAVLKKSTVSGDDGWTPEVEIHLSQYGGDVFAVFATEDAAYAGGLSGGNYTVWRKMWYQVTQMKRPGGGLFSISAATLGYVTAAYGKVFVEMADSGIKKEGDFIGNFLTPAEGFTWADGYCTAERTPWKVDYAVVQHSASKEDKVLVGTPNAALWSAGLSFRPYDFNGENWLKSAQYRVNGGAWANLPAGSVTLIGANPNRDIQVNFAGTGIDPVANIVNVQIGYKAANPVNGWGGTNLHLLICAGTFDEYYSAADRDKSMAGTCIHEPGHSLGLVYGKAWETADAAHSSHCKENACVMWWQGYLGRPHDFHLPAVTDPGCHTYVRGMDMTRSAMQPTWKFPR